MRRSRHAAIISKTVGIVNSRENFALIVNLLVRNRLIRWRSDCFTTGRIWASSSLLCYYQFDLAPPLPPPHILTVKPLSYLPLSR